GRAVRCDRCRWRSAIPRPGRRSACVRTCGSRAGHSCRLILPQGKPSRTAARNRVSKVNRPRKWPSIAATDHRRDVMALPQDIRPLNGELADSITRSSEIPWIETKPGEAWTKVLWVGQESGRWAVLLKWKKGYVALPHKHLSAAFAFVLSGKLQVRDNVYHPGDFLHEVNGMVHGATTALEDT